MRKNIDKDKIKDDLIAAQSLMIEVLYDQLNAVEELNTVLKRQLNLKPIGNEDLK